MSSNVVNIKYVYVWAYPFSLPLVMSIVLGLISNLVLLARNSWIIIIHNTKSYVRVCRSYLQLHSLPDSSIQHPVLYLDYRGNHPHPIRPWFFAPMIFSSVVYHHSSICIYMLSHNMSVRSVPRKRHLGKAFDERYFWNLRCLKTRDFSQIAANVFLRMKQSFTTRCSLCLAAAFILRATPSAAGPFWQGAWCLHFDILGDHFGTSGASWGAILAPWEPPWGTMGAAGWTRGCSLQDFIRFWDDLGTCEY